MKLRALAAVCAVVLLLCGVLLRWWFHGSDEQLAIDFGLWDTRGCTARGCATIGYTREWIDSGWRSPDGVAAFERMLLAARFTLGAAIATSLALLAALALPRARAGARRSLGRVAVVLAAIVVIGAVIVLTHRPTFQDPGMEYFSMRTGLGGGITIAGAVLAALSGVRSGT